MLPGVPTAAGGTAPCSIILPQGGDREAETEGMSALVPSLLVTFCMILTQASVFFAPPIPALLNEAKDIFPSHITGL